MIKANFAGNVKGWESNAELTPLDYKPSSNQVLFSYNLGDMLLETADRNVIKAQAIYKNMSPLAIRRKQWMRKQWEKRIQFRQSIDTLEDRVAYLKEGLSKVTVRRIL